jgi:ribonuclease BN (tRNA processing enzyme)
MLFGESGMGKTTLARALASELANQDRQAWYLGADPGAPLFTVPGAVSLGLRRDKGWTIQGLVALCTLDAARFRLPLVSAVAELARAVGGGVLLLDMPGVARGVAGAELLESLVQAAAIDLVLVLTRPGHPQPLAQELTSLPAEVVLVAAAGQARKPSALQRTRQRTRLWDASLAGGEEHAVVLDGIRLLGTPPRLAAEAWQGKLVAFLQGGRTQAMGEVLSLDGTTLRVRLPPGRRPTETLLVRDAGRDGEGLIRTVKPFAAESVHYLPPPDILPDALIPPASTGVRPIVQVGTATAALVNGIFGDPLLHLRLRHQRRSLLFDLGDGARLPARIAHQVTDVFISHAHADHIGGFPWLLRSRIGEEGVCRLYGPPGLIGHIQGFLAGFLWDRIGNRGPLFEVGEVQGDRLYRVRLQAGVAPALPLDERALPDGLLAREPGFRVRYATLDHGTPVLAYAFELDTRINIRKERLEALGLAPGPWLTGLKQRILKGNLDSLVALPDGSHRRVAELAADLTLTQAGDSLVYATDFGDTPRNRRELIALAAGAHTFFCEATFLEQDRSQAERTGHLTAKACGEIAQSADVRYLIPCHVSRRYESEPERVYAEIAAACPQTLVPKQPAWAT